MSEFHLLRRKKIIMKFTPLSVALEVLALGALVAGLLFTDRFFPSLAETVPVKFAADGSVLETGVKEVTLIHPILATFVYIIVTCVNIIIRQSCPPDRPLPMLRIVLDAVAIAKILFLAYQSALTWFALHLQPSPGWLLRALIGAEALLAAAAVLYIRKKIS